MTLRSFGEEVYETKITDAQGFSTTFQQGDDAEYDVSVDSATGYNFTQTINKSFDSTINNVTVTTLPKNTVAYVTVDQNQNPSYDPSSSCDVEYSTDGGSTWNQWFRVDIDGYNEGTKFFGPSTTIRLNPVNSSYNDEWINGTVTVDESHPEVSTIDGVNHPIPPLMVNGVTKS